ncbi:MAG: hypothetical protein JWM19_6792 [Actinomycetia bacterium]|nr:hypothetical protein [Actinomycetes bacterium]
MPTMAFFDEKEVERGLLPTEVGQAGCEAFAF